MGLGGGGHFGSCSSVPGVDALALDLAFGGGRRLYLAVCGSSDGLWTAGLETAGRSAHFLFDVCCCALCLAPAEVDLEAVSLYLNAHEPDWNLDRLRQAQAAGEPVELPRLTEVDGGYLLVQPGD